MKAKDDSLRHAIRTCFEAEPERAWRRDEIVAALDIKGGRAKRLPGLLRTMIVEGDVVELRRGVFGLGAPADLVTGELTVVRSGAAFVRDREGGADVRIDAEDQGTALPGDTVLVRLHRAPDGSRTRAGRVVRLIERASREIVGTLQSTGRFFYVVPLNPVYRKDFYVPGDAGAKLGDRVVMRFVDWPNRHVNPEGEIVDVIGPADKPSLDTEVVIRQFDLPTHFPDSVMHEAERVSGRLSRPGKREDLRKTLIVTIDPADARDFDDALSLTIDDHGRRVLGVHIADVSHFVRSGSALDIEARERGTSVYLIDKVLPMLPEQLSNGVCSLRPNEDRLAFSAFLTLDDSGAPIARRFARTRIRSGLRLSYEQALDVVEDRVPTGIDAIPAGFRELVKDLNALAQQLRERRFRSFALDLAVPETEVLIDDTGRMSGVRARVHDVSHELIEECMVAANEAVAAELSGRGIGIIARLHEPPDPEKIEQLQAELEQSGFKTGNLNQPRNLAAFVRGLADHPLRHHAHMLVLRSLKRAVYSAEATGHFGLGKQHYAHFTSPIRRYPDLVLHRQLAAYLTNPGTARFDLADLKNTALQATDREQRAEEASRALIEIKKFRFLQQQIDDQKLEVYDAVIVKVTNFGLFVDVLDLQQSGLVHVTGISERFVRFQHGDRSLRVENEVFRAGGSLRVHVVKVDFNQRRVDFALVREAPHAASRGGRGKKSRKPRKA